ncbi:MAG: hypothetical protein EOP04_08290 [Proteobacteria bacterium]|nr:MAG: hypothetical protein EOP04_08290 [Pseudomonadota bacterium]
MTHPRIVAVKASISAKFEHMMVSAKPYWTLRDQMMEYNFEVGFNKFAYRHDKHHSGEAEAWEDFGSKWMGYQKSLEDLKSTYGSVEQAFQKIKLDLLVDTDAILNQAFGVLKSQTNASKSSEIQKQGRKLFGFSPKYATDEDQDRDYPHVLVKDLIWYGRNQVNHYMDEPGRAVAKLNEFKAIFIANIEEHVHWEYSTDIQTFFCPESKISMSDEILRILDWQSYDDFQRDLEIYL